MTIKEKRHPTGMIDLRIVPYSVVMSDKEKDQFNIPRNHHTIVVDLGEVE